MPVGKKRRKKGREKKWLKVREKKRKVADENQTKVSIPRYIKNQGKKKRKQRKMLSSYWTVEAVSVAAAILVKFATAHAVIVIPTYNIIVQNTVFDLVKGTISPKPIVTIVITAQYIDLQYLCCSKEKQGERKEKKEE